MANNPVLHPHPNDATLTVTRAAEVLGVHANTVRAWSDAGRLRYYRINPRGDRRYRLGDLNRFLAVALAGPDPDAAASNRAPLARRPAMSGRRYPPLVAALHGPAGPDAATERRRGWSTDDAGANARVAITVMAGLSRIAAAIAGTAPDPVAILGSATRTIREGAGFRHVSVWRASDGQFEPVGVSGPASVRFDVAATKFGLATVAFGQPGTVIDSPGATSDPASISRIPGRRLACAIPGSGGPWGVLVAVTTDEDQPDETARDLLASTADVIGSIIRAAEAAVAVDHRLHWAEALGRVASDIDSRLNTDLLLSRVVDHAITMFGADRAAVFLFSPDGSREAAASRGLSTAYLATMSPGDPGSITTAAVNSGRPAFAVGFRDDPRGAQVRARVVQEGYDSICVAPLRDAETGDAIGSLNVYHDRQHPWSDDEVNALSRLAEQASIAVRSARTYAQLATWAAQLQSIQQLGARLNRLSDVAAIGTAIATELRDLIDYHNVRVYRRYGDDLVPVAMLGQVGEYFDETAEQLRIKVGHGITGWVAAHRVAEILQDASADPRARTIPGTDAELDESMLLAPMVFEDEVLGVLALSKLGLNQFTDDDLRLLVIYASFAAQAMAHADATQRLQHQLQSRRDLLEITESILGKLDTASVLETVTERLGELADSDNVWIELLDDARSLLIPVIAKGVNADAYMRPWLPDESGIGTWVINHNEATLVPDQFFDARVFVGEGGPVHGSLICVPLRGRQGAIGILSIERLGEERPFTEDEFELIQLFAAQVSIAVQNARAHGDIAIQAETDDLTGLRNHRSFRHELANAVLADRPFSLLMVDLDDFKLVNDTLGHEAGNAFLQACAASLVGAIRDTDTVFRYGGDEFVAILAGTDADNVRPVAERIRKAFVGIAGATPGIDESGIRVDASAGVATFPTDGTTATDILLAADRACFVVKRDRGGRVATAAEVAQLAGEFTLQTPTPIDIVQ